jgi:HAMP domain-containing protein
MKQWWQRRSLKVRLAVWFTAVAGGLLLGLAPVVYLLIERRLHEEFDRQLRIDWDLVEAHLEADPAGRIQWRAGSPATPDSPGDAATWFEVWAGTAALLRHHPPGGAPIAAPPQMPADPESPFYTVTLANGLPARALEQAARIGPHEVILRVFRDESGLRHTLREILLGFALGVPLAAVLAALGGYVLAGRMLKPVGVIAAQARRITSESLHQRLPNPNPHDELGQLAAVFNETLQRLDNSFESLKRFTADASHELRTPLAALPSVGEVACVKRARPASCARRSAACSRRRSGSTTSSTRC